MASRNIAGRGRGNSRGSPGSSAAGRGRNTRRDSTSVDRSGGHGRPTIADIPPAIDGTPVASNQAGTASPDANLANSSSSGGTADSNLGVTSINDGSTPSSNGTGSVTLDCDGPLLQRDPRRSTMDSAQLAAAIQQNNTLHSPLCQGRLFPVPNQQQMAPVTTVQPPQAANANLGRQQVTRLMVDGQPMNIVAQPRPESSAQSKRLWSKLVRHTLPADIKQTFVKAATGYVLSKTNKLSIQSYKLDDENALEHVYNLRQQLKQLETHCYQYDIKDVFTIQSPVDVANSSDLKDPVEVYDLFNDYAKLHVSHVANSNAYYQRWVGDDYVHENLNLTFTLLQNNTEESLWAKCLEDYEEFGPYQRGGPLMFYLIVRRIHNSSESAIEFLLTRIRNLNLKSIEGENVERAVSLIKSTHKALTSASTADRSYVPDDFPCTILKIFQTSSVPEFNSTFEKEITDARRYADKYGGQPSWPSISQILTLASNTYMRLKSDGSWDVPSGTKKSAYMSSSDAPPGSNRSSNRGSNSNSRPKGKIKCFNCGEEHALPDCTKPRDEDRIAKNRKDYMDRKKGQSKPRRKVSKDGKPLIRNKKGAYVLDQKKWKRQKEKDELKAMVSQLTSLSSSSDDTMDSSSSSSGQDTSTKSASQQKNAFKEQMAQLADRIANMK